MEDVYKNKKVMDGDEEENGSLFLSSSFSEDCCSSDSSMSSFFMEDSTTATSSSSSSASFQALACDQIEEEEGPLFKMSSLMALLPLKKGLSKHFQGKSKSFTSLANARSLEDIVKPERRASYKKKLKTCKSYAGGLDGGKAVLSLSLSSIAITKKPSRGSNSSLSGRRQRSSRVLYD
ncbi:hypothetical protein J5N97_016453 [Dioscorea zingiberensis]|uniref:Oxidative stress 3 n=1 Tax=Dioscorea zingiberensis TaxID=325984 RepID=A0A9D5CJC7_9LILI|nr:hypothetical protein J5N97_016453 [Dioscorea zingiberensis]